MSIKKMAGLCDKDSRVFVYPHPTDPRVVFDVYIVAQHRGRFYLPGVVSEEARGRQLVLGRDLKVRRGLLADVAGKLGDFEGVFQDVAPYMREQLELPVRFTVNLTKVLPFVNEHNGILCTPWVIGGRMYASDGVKGLSVGVERECADEVCVPAPLVKVGGVWSYHGEGWWHGDGDVWYFQDQGRHRDVKQHLYTLISLVSGGGGEVVDPVWLQGVRKLKCTGFCEGLAPYQNSCMPILYRGRVTGQGEGWSDLTGEGPDLAEAYNLRHLEAVLKRHKGCEFRMWEDVTVQPVLRVSCEGVEYVVCPLRATKEVDVEEW